MMISTITTEEQGVKTRLKAMWAAGDYDRFSRFMEAGAHDRLALAPGTRSLDVACGSGHWRSWQLEMELTSSA